MINARANHFRAETSPECTFCTLKKLLPAPKKTIEHLFWYCPAVNHVILIATANIINRPVGKKFFFTGSNNDEKFCKAAMLYFDVIEYVIWELKRLKKYLQKAIANIG
jgi:hypothetical protein